MRKPSPNPAESIDFQEPSAPAWKTQCAACAHRLVEDVHIWKCAACKSGPYLMYCFAARLSTAKKHCGPGANRFTPNEEITA